MEQLNTSHPSITPIETDNLVSFDHYWSENSSLLHQCDDPDVMFHVSFLTISHAIEKAMLYLRWQPSFDRFEDFFESCEQLIFSYQSEWLDRAGADNWKQESLKIADNLSPSFKGRRKINEAVKCYMDENFLMDTVLSELRRVASLSKQERLYIVQEGIPFLKKTIRLSVLDPVELTLLEPS